MEPERFMYEGEELTVREIAHKIGRSVAVVWKWLGMMDKDINRVIEHHKRVPKRQIDADWFSSETKRMSVELGISYPLMSWYVKRYGAKDGFDRAKKSLKTKKENKANKKPSETYRDETEKLHTCLCPKCRKTHKKLMFFTGTGTPRFFCRVCSSEAEKHSPLSEVSLSWGRP